MKRGREPKNDRKKTERAAAVLLLILALAAGLLPSRSFPAETAGEGVWGADGITDLIGSAEWENMEESDTESDTEWETTEAWAAETTPEELSEEESIPEESCGEENSAEETTGEESSVVESIPSESFAEESTVEESSTVETSTEESSAAETSAAESSMEESTVEETSAVESTSEESSAEETVSEGISENEVEPAETPAGESSGEETLPAEPGGVPENEVEAAEVTSPVPSVRETSPAAPVPSAREERPPQDGDGRTSPSAGPARPEKSAARKGEKPEDGAARKEEDPERKAEEQGQEPAESPGAEPVPEELPEPAAEPDRTAPRTELVTDLAGPEEICSTDVTVGVKVTDPAPSDGFRSITYEVLDAATREQLQTGVLWQEERPAEAERTARQWQGAVRIRAGEREGEVLLLLTAVDHGGNRRVEELPVEMDALAPRVKVSFPGAAARNGSYYPGQRTARIRIEEEHFSRDLVEITASGEYRGKSLPEPEIRWSEEDGGPVAELLFSADGTYEFSVQASDLAGNRGELWSSGSFVIDSRPPEIRIRGVRDGSVLGAAAAEETQEIGVSISDDFPGGSRIRLLRSRVLADGEDPTEVITEEQADVTDRFLTAGESTAEELRFRIPERDAGGQSSDGLYTLKVSARDRAGNASEEKVVFSVNRFGSVYVLDSSVYGLVRDGGACVRSVKETLIIREYSPAPLADAEATVIRDFQEEEKALSGEAVLGTQEHEPGNGWYIYTYRLEPALFARDGLYRVRLSSRDRAGGRSENRSGAAAEIRFRVDSTPPELLSVRGAEQELVEAGSCEIRFEAFDAMGIARAEAWVNGQPVLREESFADAVHVQEGFRLRAGEDQQIRICLTDRAGNVLDTAEQTEEGEYSFRPLYEFHRRITVRPVHPLAQFLQQLFPENVARAAPADALSEEAAEASRTDADSGSLPLVFRVIMAALFGASAGGITCLIRRYLRRRRRRR